MSGPSMLQLSDEEAARLTRAEVLARGGPIAAPVRDDWLPGQEPAPDWEVRVDPGAVPDPPHRVAHVQEAVSAIVGLAEGRGGLGRITLAPGRHEGPMILPDLPGLRFEVTGAGTGETELCAAIDAEMPGVEFRHRFEPCFEAACPTVRAYLAGLAARPTLSTAHAAVLRVEAPGSRIAALTVRNSYACDRSAAAEGTARNARGQFASGQHQAVAVLTRADRVALEGLDLRSHQDTLYLQSPPGAICRVAVRDCRIEGDVDFIFGQATAHFEGCRIVSLGHRAPRSWVCAPATNIRQPFGFVFETCVFAQEGPANAAAGRVLLGRQWFEGVRASPYREAVDPEFRVRLGARSRLAPPDSTISRASLEAVGKCVILRSRIAEGYNLAAPWSGWNTGHADREGRAYAETPHPRMRPLQARAGDFLHLLGAWLAREGLDYGDLDPRAPWIGLHGCEVIG